MKRTVGTVIVVAAVAGATVAGCGGSSAKTTTTMTHSATRSTTRTSAPATAATATTPTVTSGPVHASLHGANHSPTAGKRWLYTVHATDASGKPLNGTVVTEFAFGGMVVGRESPPIHRLKAGVLRDRVTFPGTSVGHPITLVTVIHTSAGSVALGWPVTAKK